MNIEIKVPSPGESITEVQLASWLIESGDYVEKDQEIAEIDSDKATLSISAEESGTIECLIEAGDVIAVGTIIANINTNGKSKGKPTKKEAVVEIKLTDEELKTAETSGTHISPLAQKLMLLENLSEAELLNFFKGVRISRKDVELFLEEKAKLTSKTNLNKEFSRDTEVKEMSRLRTKLAERLVAVKNETAMLTTFNEVNMTSIMSIRKKFKEQFKEKHGVGLGFMSFFTKAITEAMADFPSINSMIDGGKIITYKYADVGIAVSAPKGLMVPILRNAEAMSLAEIEQDILRLATKARNNKLSLNEMQGGTFTITNGGVFGSMLSTPIINPPQSAILGMHNIMDRPIAVNGKVEIHPMMYIALSYDHRIIDGKDSVGFLVKVKELLESPEKMLFDGKDPIEILLGL